MRPQWAQMVAEAIGWPSFEDAVWWIHAHTKDSQWIVDEQVRQAWAAEVAERTPLSANDLIDGAVDVTWFNRVVKQLGKQRWAKVCAAAKFASGGGGHARATLFADAMLGQVKKDDLVKRIREKRNQDAVRALGLALLGRGKSRDRDLLGRYELIQKFVRESRQYGSQRQASEKKAARIAQRIWRGTADMRIRYVCSGRGGACDRRSGRRAIRDMR